MVSKWCQTIESGFSDTLRRFPESLISALFQTSTASIDPRTPERYKISDNTTALLPRESDGRMPVCEILSAEGVCVPLWRLLQGSS